MAKHFPIEKNLFRSRAASVVKAVDGVSFEVLHGQTLGIVGESGCGKSTAALLILKILPATAGSIFFNGVDVTKLSQNAFKPMRRMMQIVFQDPHESLNPKMKIGEIVGEPLVVHKIANGMELQRKVEGLLDSVGLSSSYSKRYPREFSGGQRQRIGIARALASSPKLIVCDEPVSSLDVSIQAQIINLLTELQQRYRLSYIFISHDLSVIRHVSSRIAVMYLGKIMELADKDALFTNALHPYTQALLSAMPVPDPENRKKRILLEGEIPNPINPPSGCRFCTRCRQVFAKCLSIEPEVLEINPGHYVRCHLY